MSKIQRKIIRAINAIVPKRKHKVMLASWPDYSDNARALFEYMVSQPKYSDWRYVWVVKPNFNVPKCPSNISFISEASPKLSVKYLIYLYHVFTSKYFFCTHSSFAEANPRLQKTVCLWHGTMLKRICGMNDREKTEPKKDQFRFFISPSSYYVDFFCQSFLCDKRAVLVTGYPRNDMLFQKTNILEKLDIDKRGKKIIVYMPTFRNPIGGGYSDSNAKEQCLIDFCKTSEVAHIDEHLGKLNCMLLVKWHPSDTRQNISVKTTNIISVSNNEMSEKDLQTYHLLHFSDALITDYSSVFCDYMMLDRPIAFDISDIGSYSENRGFVFDNPIDYMPGYILKNNRELFDFLKDIAEGIDKSRDLRHSLYNIYNDFQDNQSSKRIVEKVIYR